MEMNAISEYYKDILSSSPDRLIVYAPSDQSGWGNKIRGFVSCFIIALATRRALVVDEPLILDNFVPPDGIDWDSKPFRKILRKKSVQKKLLATHALPDERNDGVWAAFSIKNFDELYPEQIILHKDGTSIADALIANPRYADVWKACRIDLSTRVTWHGVVTSYLLANPTKKLVQHYKSQCHELLRHPERLKVGVQFRTFHDIGAPWMQYLGSFIQNVNQKVLAPLRKAHPIVLFITTDNLPALEKMAEEMFGAGDIMVKSRKMFHTGTTNAGLLRILEKAMKKVHVIQRDFYLDFNRFLPKWLRYHRHLNILADWYALGECDVIASTFTSFGAFAAARTGNRAVLWKIDIAEGYCGMLDDKHYSF